MKVQVLDIWMLSPNFVHCFSGYEKEASKITTQVYQNRKSSDSPRSFRSGKTRRTNQTTLQKVFKTL